MATSYNAFARVHSLPPATRMPLPSSVSATSAPTFRISQARSQPQSRKAAPRAAAFFALPKEPEDARITGGTRSLDRRLLALNLPDTRLWRESRSLKMLMAS